MSRRRGGSLDNLPKDEQLPFWVGKLADAFRGGNDFLVGYSLGKLADCGHEVDVKGDVVSVKDGDGFEWLTIRRRGDG